AAPATGSTPAPAATTPSTAPAKSTPAKGASKTTKSEAKGKTEAAGPDTLAMLEHAVARDSSQIDNLYKLGVMYLDRDRVAEASRVLLKATQLRPKDHRAFVNLGAAYDAGGHAQEAQEAYKKALTLAPGDSVATCR